MTDQPHETHERWILGTELIWAFGVGVLVAATISVIVFTALTLNINPPSNVERVDPKTLHLSGEFSEQNLGTLVAADGTVTARIIATQFTFVPHCIALPRGRPVTLRLASDHRCKADRQRDRWPSGILSGGIAIIEVATLALIFRGFLMRSARAKGLWGANLEWH
jgi:hypothetical protein